MESLIQDLYTFEAEHAWWSPETFQRLDNLVLKDATEDALTRHHYYVQNLIQTATAEDMDSLKEALEKGSQKMLPITLTCLLDLFYREATEFEKPISKEAIMWYRQQGWKFPNFPHEE